VARTVKEIIDCTDEPSLLRELEGPITSKDVYDAAVRGDKVAQEVFNFTGTVLGEALADFIAFSAPEAIILFGGLARSREFIEKPIIESMNKNVVSIWKDKVKVEFSQLKDSDAAILGASALGWEL
jgi:glucokinase